MRTSVRQPLMRHSQRKDSLTASSPAERVALREATKFARLQILRSRERIAALET